MRLPFLNMDLYLQCLELGYKKQPFPDKEINLIKSIFLIIK